MPNPKNITNIPAPRVDFIDSRTGLMAREWYRFFLNIFQLTGSGQNETSLEDLQLGPPLITEENVNNVNSDIDALKQQPTQQSAVEQISEVKKTVDGILISPRPELGTMSALQQAWLPWVTFDNAPEFTPPTVGTVAWDGGTTLGVQMTANVVGRVNESAYYYIKASSSITLGQVVMFTGAVGASGVPTGAPATGVTDGSYIMGIAAESIPLNRFGLVQFVGTLKGLNTSAYADGEILWYDPAVTGGLTKTKPSAPNVKVQMAAVINAGSGGSGSILIRVSAGSELGGTDSNVKFGALSDKDLIQYDSTHQYWKNVSAASLAAGSLAGGVAGDLPYQSGTGTTTFLNIGAANRVLTSSGTAPQWSNQLLGLGQVQGANLSGTSLTAHPLYYGQISGYTGAIIGGTAATLAVGCFTPTSGYSAIGKVRFVGPDGSLSRAGIECNEEASQYAAYLTFSTNNSAQTYTEHMRLTSAGNLGIGTSSPGAKLEVANGYAYVNLTPETGTVTNQYGLYVDRTSSAGATATNVYGVLVNSLNYATGKTTTNAYGLYVGTLYATNTWGVYQAASANPNYFAGNVGIGTTSPASLLDVNGNAQVKGTGTLLVVGSGLLGYGTGSGGAATQSTSRTTGVTLNKTNGAITLVSAAGSATWQTFTVTNSAVSATDVIRVCQKSGTDKYQIHVTNVTAGSFDITFATTGGTTTEQPVFNFAVMKASTS